MSDAAGFFHRPRVPLLIESSRMNLQPLILDMPALLGLDAASEQDAIARTAGLLGNDPKISDCPAFLQAVLDRQRINPPLLGSGIALPHARTAVVKEIVCVAARCATEVPFGPEQTPVRLIFLFGIPPQQISQYLALTAGLVKRLRRPEILAGLLAADSADEFQRWLEA